jgi:hypothetical protein
LLHVQPDWDHASNAKGLLASVPQPSHAARRTFAEDFCLREKNGSVAALLLCDVIPKTLHRHAFDSWWDHVTDRVTNRGSVLGTKSLPKNTRRDGKPSGFKGVNVDILDTTRAGQARQATLGWGDGGITPITRKYPDMLDANRELIERVDKLFEQHLPQFHEKAQTAIEKGPAKCRRWKTAFTSVYLFRGFSSRYHKDKNNLSGVLTAITPVGDFTGGALVLPRWEIAVAFKPGDVLFFDPQQVHGNLPFKGKRISAALYCSRSIADVAGVNYDTRRGAAT